MRNLSSFLVLALIQVVAISCKEDLPTTYPSDPDLFSDGFFILNEGNFGTGNSSLDFFQRDSGLIRDVYARFNAGISPGDVLQSMNLIDDQFFLVVNNSGKIQVINPVTGIAGGSITGLVSPRYILSVGNNKAYVSDLFSGNISILNTQTLSVSGQISVGSWTERMVLNDNHVYVSLMGRDKIWKIDPTTDEVIDSLDTGREPEGLLADDEGNLFVLSTGGFMEAFPEIRSIKTSDGSLTRQWIIGDFGQYASDLAISPNGAWLYWLMDDGIYRMASDAAIPPDSPWISSPVGSFWYCLDVDRNDTGEVLVGDAVDFTSQGKVMRYSPQGILLDSMATGVNPGAFFFVQ
jgi:YVTN family beta-propeller protein